MSLYDVALKIASDAHKGQVDKAGVDYIQHPIYVASLVTDEKAKVVALLHDVIEDSAYTLADLRARGFTEEIVTAVATSTKPKNVSYEDYLKKVKANHLARKVKLADLQHNSDLTRLSKVSEDDLKRVQKYQAAITFLKA